jgi:hypothetical protein
VVGERLTKHQFGGQILLAEFSPASFLGREWHYDCSLFTLLGHTPLTSDKDGLILSLQHIVAVCRDGYARNITQNVLTGKAVKRIFGTPETCIAPKTVGAFCVEYFYHFALI